MAAIGQTASAQISAGSIFVTGFGSISTMGGETEMTGAPTTEHDKEFSGRLGVGGGYFLTDQIAVGLNLSFRGSKLTPEDTSDPITREREIGYGVFARYYVPLSDQFFFHGQLGLGLSNGSSTMENQNTGTTEDGPKFSTLELGLRPGFTFFPTPKWGFDMSVGFIGIDNRKDVMEIGSTTITSKSNEFNARFDLTTVFFGIQYFIN